MKTIATLMVVLAALVVEPAAARACLWDYDTLKEESIGDKELAQVLGGELRHHSDAFYAAKVTYTRAIVDKGDAVKERYDDLAVALAKTGKVDDALAVLDAKDKRFPGEYTTLANRSVFLAMKSDHAGALEQVKQALAINPDAHFGREQVQVKLHAYYVRLAADPALAKTENFLGVPMTHDVLIQGQSAKADKELDKPIQAITGMIRFGGAAGDPHVWFALGWALASRGDNQLAIRAFRRAEKLGHPRAAGDGAVVATTLRKLDPESPCCPEPDSDIAKAVWAKAVVAIDKAWPKGEAADAKRQAREDKKITKQQWKAAFGY